ncbi:MAG: long-chain fatty acid--CoA ligase [Candidatus Omnitrophota bacterium]
MQDTIQDLSQILVSVTSRHAHRTAIIFGSKTVTYAQLDAYCRRLACALSHLGVKELDKVALWLPNCPEFVYTFFAALYIRAIAVPINTMFKQEEAKFILQDSGARILICSIDKVHESESILSRVDSLKHVICLPAPKSNTNVLDFYDLISRHEASICEPRIASDDIAEIVYTSGTTGKPKGACLTHKNILSNIRDCGSIIEVSHRDCFICILPLFHSFASTVCMLLPLYNGARIVIMRSVRPFKRVVRAIFKHRVTAFMGVPSIFNILSEAHFPRWQLLLNWLINPIRLCISGAAALPFEVWYKFEKKFKRPLLQGYGLTEASPVVSLNPLRGENKPYSVGRALPAVTAKIIDKDGKEVLPQEVGELLVKGDNVMQGYYRLPDETGKALRDGWLYTGDLAKIDKDGFIYIMGRLKEMINVRGLNVYPKEIEDVLYKYPKVKEAAVVGVLHRHRGEAPVAFIVKKEEVKEGEVIAFLRNNLASYKIPLRVFFKESLPKNATGKILKVELQKEVENIFT